MIETPVPAEVVILVHVTLPRVSTQADFDEFHELAVSAGISPALEIHAICRSACVKYLIGKGKVEEIHQAVKAHGADLVIFSHDLTPAQTRNIERKIECRVVDRVDLILDIFAQRAQTFEGKLQVELAQLQHLSTRLIRGWTHLERQKGGIGLRGPGETQLEVDRRLIRGRIKAITKRLDKVRKDRSGRRRTRHRANISTVALVGYTNAGKSTLFNALSDSDAYVADQLFATLDPTLRALHLSEFGKVVLADTVGFVRDLPHDLVDAFRATLEETRDADVLLHVIDAVDPESRYKMSEVNKVLEQIEADEVPALLVFNKVDLMDDETPHIEYNAAGRPVKVWVSAVSGQGLSELKQAIVDILSEDIVEQEISLSSTQGKLRSTLYNLDAVVSEQVALDGSYELVVRLPRQKLMRLLSEN